MGVKSLLKVGGQVVMMCAAAAYSAKVWGEGGGGQLPPLHPPSLLTPPETQYKMADLVKRILTLNFLYHSLLL